MSNSTMSEVAEKIKNSLFQKGIVTDPSFTCPTYTIRDSPSLKFSTKPFDISVAENSSPPHSATKVNFFNSELNTLRGEMNSNVVQLRKEIDDKTKKNSYYTYNEELSKFRKTTTEEDNNIKIQMKQLWLKMEDLQSEMYVLKSQSNTFIQNEGDIKLQLNNLVQTGNEHNEKINKITTNINNDILSWIKEVNKRERQMCENINLLSKNEKVNNTNISKIMDKLNKNAIEIKEIRNGPSKSYNVYNNNNEFELIRQSDFNIYKSSVANQIENLKESFNKEINELKMENKALKDLIAKLETQNQEQFNDINNKFNLDVYGYNNKLNDDNDEFRKFKIKQESINEENSNKIKELQDSINEINEKIERMNEFNMTTFTTIDSNMKEMEKVLQKVNTNENNIEVLDKNMKNIEDNSNNMKNEINNYKEELSRWQEQLAEHFDDQVKGIKKCYENKEAEDLKKDEYNEEEEEDIAV